MNAVFRKKAKKVSEYILLVERAAIFATGCPKISG